MKLTGETDNQFHWSRRSVSNMCQNVESVWIKLRILDLRQNVSGKFIVILFNGHLRYHASDIMIHQTTEKMFATQTSIRILRFGIDGNFLCFY
jgi:hypothetical protein